MADDPEILKRFKRLKIDLIKDNQSPPYVEKVPYVEKIEKIEKDKEQVKEGNQLSKLTDARFDSWRKQRLKDNNIPLLPLLPSANRIGKFHEYDLNWEKVWPNIEASEDLILFHKFMTEEQRNKVFDKFSSIEKLRYTEYLHQYNMVSQIKLDEKNEDEDVYYNQSYKRKRQNPN